MGTEVYRKPVTVTPCFTGRFAVHLRGMCERLLVVSDTHGSVNALAAVLSLAKELEPAAAAFLGDGLGDVEAACEIAGFACRWHKVKGNNDFGLRGGEAETFELGGHRFFICHGHRHGIYGGPELLAAAARNVGAGTVLFGHTHVPSLDEADGLVFVNPGSVGSPRSAVGATFAVIECTPGQPPRPLFRGLTPAGTLTPVPVERAWIRR